MWPGEPAVGKRVHLGTPNDETAEIVGVVAGMQDLVPGERPKPYVFRPLRQTFSPQMTLLVHTASAPSALISSLRRAIVATDPTLAVYDTRSMSELDPPPPRHDFGTSPTVHHTNYFEQPDTLDFVLESLGVP